MSDRDLQHAYAEALARRHVTGRDGCPAPEALYELVVRDGAEADRLRTLDHVMQCPHCKRDFDLLHAVESAEPRQRRFLVPGLAVAAVAVFAVVGAVVWGPGTNDAPVFRGEDTIPQLVAPAGSLDAPPDLLVWRAVDDAVSYRFEITAPDGSLVASGTTSDTMFSVLSETAFRDGVVYTWRVEAVQPGGIRRALGSTTFEVER